MALCFLGWAHSPSPNRPPSISLVHVVSPDRSSPPSVACRCLSLEPPLLQSSHHHPHIFSSTWLRQADPHPLSPFSSSRKWSRRAPCRLSHLPHRPSTPRCSKSIRCNLMSTPEHWSSPVPRRVSSCRRHLFPLLGEPLSVCCGSLSACASPPPRFPGDVGAAAHRWRAPELLSHRNATVVPYLHRLTMD
jgi:hypothetical protein